MKFGSWAEKLLPTTTLSSKSRDLHRGFITAITVWFICSIANVILTIIVYFIVACLVSKPLNWNEAKGDLVMIQTLLPFKGKLLCYHANLIMVSITTLSTSASLQIKGLATKYTTKKQGLLVIINICINCCKVKEAHFRAYPHWKWCTKDRKKSPRKVSDRTESSDSVGKYRSVPNINTLYR